MVTNIVKQIVVELTEEEVKTLKATNKILRELMKLMKDNQCNFIEYEDYENYGSYQLSDIDEADTLIENLLYCTEIV